MSCCQTRNRNAEGRAGHIVQANVVAEDNRRRISTVLTADTQFDIRARRTAKLNSHFHQLAYADLVQSLEGIRFVDLFVVVLIEELASVVTGESKRHLR